MCFPVEDPRVLASLVRRARIEIRQPHFGCLAHLRNCRHPDRADPSAQAAHPSLPFRRCVGAQELVGHIRAATNVVITGTAGAGKTSALLETATRLLDEPDGLISVFVPLADWAAEGGEFVQFASAELGVSPEEVVQLADAGVLVWLLDGWNELPVDLVREAESHLRNLDRRLGNVAIVVSTRGRENAPPLTNPLELSTRPLSRAQRRRIVTGCGPGGPGAIPNEITRTPLFLSTAVAVVRGGGELPESGYQLLSTFVSDAERGLHRAALFLAVFIVCHW